MKTPQDCSELRELQGWRIASISFSKEGGCHITKKKTEKKTALFSEDDSEDELCCDDGNCDVFENEGQGQAAQQTQDGMREFNRMQLAAVRLEDIVRS